MNIPSDKYSYKLREYLYPFLLSKDENEKETAMLLMRISKMDIPHKNSGKEDISKVKLSEEEKAIIISNGWLESDNIEVKSRCNDIMLKAYQGDRRGKALMICNDYLQVYTTIEYGAAYLLRSMQIANYFHISDAVYLNHVCKFICQVPSAWRKDFAKEAKSLLTKEQKDKFINFLLTAKEEIDYPKNHASNERDCLDSLYTLGYYSKDEYLHETALSFERTADYFDKIHRDNPHTYQYGAYSYMDEAYKRIVKVKKEYREDFLRIQGKLVGQQKIVNEAIGIFGVKIQYKVNDEMMESVSQVLCGKDSMHVISWLLEIPFLNDSKIRSKEKNAGEDYKFLYDSFSKSLFNDAEGNTVGSANGTEVVGEEWYRDYRVNIRAVVVYCLNYISLLDVHNFGEWLSKQIKDNKPSFVDEDKVHLWQRGLLAGINFDFDLSTFILVPLVEQAIHNLAEERSGEDLTELEKEIQKEPALGKDIKILEGHIDEGERRELSLFLEKGSGENIRNKVAHGLITDNEIRLWGPYLWWIAMKIYFGRI